MALKSSSFRGVTPATLGVMVVWPELNAPVSGETASS
jgi:hypothetical protein